MVNKTGNIEPKLLTSLEMKSSIGTSKTPEKTEPMDSFNSADVQDAPQSNNFIIIPPKDIRDKDMFKADNEGGLSKFDVEIDKKLDLIGAYSAQLDDSQKTELENAGYTLYADKKVNLIPSTPNYAELMKTMSVSEFLGYDVNMAPGMPGFPNMPGMPGMPMPGLPGLPGIGRNPRGPMPSIEEMTSIKDRPVLTEPRFDSELTKKYTGKGVTIAVIDSGIYPHPDLLNSDRKIWFKDHVYGREIMYDDNGHGTHCAGDAAGSGKGSNGLFKGLAPDANLYAVKAMDKNGAGNVAVILAAIQDVIEHKDEYNIKVLSMSLGFPSMGDPMQNPINMMVQKAAEAGILVIAASGNSGPNTLSSPAEDQTVLAVGAIDDNNTKDRSDDKVANFSSGAVSQATGRVTPDVVAPGYEIISTNAPGGPGEEMARGASNMAEEFKWLASLDDKSLQNYPEAKLQAMRLPPQYIQEWRKNPTVARMLIKKMYDMTQGTHAVKGDQYVAMPGTSMACPRVAGLAAEIFEANPNLSPREVMNVIKNTAYKMEGETAIRQGFGAIDPDKAIQAALDAKEGKTEMLKNSYIRIQPPSMSGLNGLFGGGRGGYPVFGGGFDANSTQETK
jgi:subtilisin family serine protease